MQLIYNISDNAAKGLSKLSSISDAAFQNLCDVIATTNPTIQVSRFARQVSTSAPNILASDIEEIFEGVRYLIYFREKDDASPDFIVDEIFRLIGEGKAGGLKFENEGQATKFKERLPKLLLNEKLLYSRRIGNLYYEHEKLFSSLKIINDIRPVFDKGAKNLPTVGVISSTLHVSYQGNGRHKDIYMGVDPEDINLIRRALDQAENEIKSLQSICEKVGMKNIKIEQGK